MPPRTCRFQRSVRIISAMAANPKAAFTAVTATCIPTLKLSRAVLATGLLRKT